MDLASTLKNTAYLLSTGLGQFLHQTILDTFAHLSNTSLIFLLIYLLPPCGILAFSQPYVDRCFSHDYASKKGFKSTHFV